MTTATLTRPAGIFASWNHVKVVPAFSVSDLADVFTRSLAMARAVPDSGRVSAKDMAKVRLIADAL